MYLILDVVVSLLAYALFYRCLLPVLRYIVHYQRSKNVQKNNYTDFMNGLTRNNIHLPKEVCIEILCNVETETLLQSQSSSKRCHASRTSVWLRKVERAIGLSKPPKTNIPWDVYYTLSKMNFERNLLKNHIDEDENDYGVHFIEPVMFTLLTLDEKVGKSCIPSDLLEDPLFNRTDYCFMFGDALEFKCQQISLPKEGYPSKFMDVLQPPIEVNVWYNFTKESFYSLKVYMYSENQLTDICSFEYYTKGSKNNLNQWFKITYVFRNYGPGVTKIGFRTGGAKLKSKACVQVLSPEILPDNFSNLLK